MPFNAIDHTPEQRKTIMDFINKTLDFSDSIKTQTAIISALRQIITIDNKKENLN